MAKNCSIKAFAAGCVEQAGGVTITKKHGAYCVTGADKHGDRISTCRRTPTLARKVAAAARAGRPLPTEGYHPMASTPLRGTTGAKARTFHRGNEYGTIQPDGRVTTENWKGSSNWVVTGAVERNQFGNVVRRYSLEEVLELGPKIPWKWKNGKQRTFITDRDHGTPREWRSPRFVVF